MNDNTPVFLPISETFGEQLGLMHPVGSSARTHALPYSLAVRTFPQPLQGCERCRDQAGVTQCFP